MVQRIARVEPQLPAQPQVVQRITSTAAAAAAAGGPPSAAAAAALAKANVLRTSGAALALIAPLNIAAAAAGQMTQHVASQGDRLAAANIDGAERIATVDTVLVPNFGDELQPHLAARAEDAPPLLKKLHLVAHEAQRRDGDDEVYARRAQRNAHPRVAVDVAHAARRRDLPRPR